MTEQFEVEVNNLRRCCDPDGFSFETTEELEEMDAVIGQQRAVKSVSFGIDIKSPGYHMYALGPPGTGKSTTVKKFLESRAPDEPVPADWCYVNNFEDADKPSSIRLPAGLGKDFEADIDRLIQELNNEIPRSFQTDEYQQEKEEIQEEYQQQRKQVLIDLESKADEKNFAVMQNPRGLILAPIKDGDVIPPDEINKLSDEERKKFNDEREELQTELRRVMRQIRQIQVEAQKKIRDLDREVLGFAVGHLLEELKDKYSSQKQVIEYLEAMREDIKNKVNVFKNIGRQEDEQPSLAAFIGQEPSLDDYKINLIVDNSETEGAPVVLESNPTYYNLLGRIEHRGQFGTMLTDYTMIKGGALHRANGGYLIIEAKDILTSPFAWDALKRSLKNKEIKTEIMGQEYRSIQAQTLEPEPIPLQIKVIVIGDPLLYYLLYNRDEDFQELFKVKADFSVETDWGEETEQQYARFIADLCRNEKLRHFTPCGVGRVIEYCGRMAASQKKLDTKFGDIVDMIREAAYWADKNGNEYVEGVDVQKAIDEKVYRSNRIEEKIRELIEEKTLLIDTTGQQVGQVNGISVIPLGDYAFGKPSRITARTHVGSQGIVNVEREIEMSGRVHNKGVMILSGYLGGQFALDIPLALSASITFEQLYEEVEGDSASSSELYALLSSLSGFPIRQDLAVTGSVNQRGQVQAIGGVNEKIEGFFDVCRLEGLTGHQGVIIPASNVNNLMVRADVVEAVKNGKFSIYAVKSIGEGIELLTGKPAGEKQQDGSYPEGSVNYAVQKKLKELAEKAKKFSQSPDDDKE